jgi:hypothetical protein
MAVDLIWRRYNDSSHFAAFASLGTPKTSM